MAKCSYCNGKFAKTKLTTLDRGTILQLCPACHNLSDPQKSPSSLLVRPMEEDDLELVLAWRNNPEIYEHFVEQEGIIAWDDHVKWYESRPADRRDYIIRYQDRRVGVVSLDESDFVSIYIGEIPLWGEGIASRMLNWLTKRHHPDRSLQAEIHMNNKRSQELFEKCGFVQSDRDGDWIIYKYKPDDDNQPVS